MAQDRQNSTQKIIDAIIFISFTDGEYEMLLDTLESIEYYVKELHHIIAIDDCSQGMLGEKIKTAKPDITVLRNERKHGGRSGLYVTMAKAYKYALSNFTFKVFMKMDTDALMVGAGLISQAREYFEAHPNVGILGSYRIRSDGKKRHWGKWRIAFFYESSPIRFLVGKSVLWRPIIREAFKHGYNMGENVLGGAYFIRYECIQAMYEKGYLDYRYEDILKQSKIGDEIIYSLLCKACGYDLQDFGTPEHSMAIALDCLPLKKEEIVTLGKTAIHSLKKGKDGESQAELRQFFRSLRVHQG